MLNIEKRVLLFKTKDIHFAEYPYDVDGCDAVTFVDCTDKVDTEDFVYRKKLTFVIDLTQDIEVIFNDMSKSSTRQRIKRAEKDGTRIHTNKHFDEFYKINKRFQQSKGFGTTLDIMTQSTNFMKRYSTLFAAEYEGEILGGHLYLEDENHIKLWHSASKRLETDKQKATIIGRANRLLHWEAIKYAKEKGLKEFDWGGMWPQEEADTDEKKKAINSFKSSFGGEVATRYEYKKVYSKSYKFAQRLYGMK
ncbi:MAG: GNAT family N-acetyltransferase [bacterium]|nr:GNAT family N-acetyltransferase [bacterium]